MDCVQCSGNPDSCKRYLVLFFYVNGETSAGLMLALVLDFRPDLLLAWQENNQTGGSVSGKACQEKLF